MKTLTIALTTTALMLTAAPTTEAVASDAATFVGVVAKAKPDPREYARRASRSANDYRCLVVLWTRESHWNHKAKNPNSSAFGIAQMLREKSKDPYVQIDHGMKYIKARYGTACSALRFHTQHGWY